MEPFRFSCMDDGFIEDDMKIVFVNDAILGYALKKPTRIGGAEKQQWLLAKALRKSGWDVTVGVRYGLEEKNTVTVDGVHFVGMGTGQFLWDCHRFLSSERPDWWYWRAADLWLGPAAKIARLLRVRMIFAAAFDTDVTPHCALFRRPRCWPLYAWGLAITDKIFVQHGIQLSQLKQKWQPKAYVVPSLVEGLLAAPSHKDHKAYVAWSGTLRRPKRADLLIKLAQKLTDIKFVVCGGVSHFQSSHVYGSQMVEALQTLPNVEFLGQVAPEKSQQVIAEASVLLCTSDGEGFPNTFLEAWKNGTAVVSLTIDPDKIIEQKGLGTVSGNIQSAQKDIQDLMTSEVRRKEIAMRAQAYVMEYHSPEAVINIFERSLNAVDSRDL